MRNLGRWLLAVPIVVACLVCLARLDPRLWVGLSALVSALGLRSMVVGWRRATGKKPLEVMATMCWSFVGAAAATLTITLMEGSPGLVVMLLTGYLSALSYGTAAELVAQMVTWAVAARRESVG